MSLLIIVTFQLLIIHLNMNIHIIRHATQAFADVICAEGSEAMRKGIAIAHDCRLNSRLFAEEAACVMTANGIHVRLFDALRPTPELSFAVIHYGTAAGLNITASHNPKEYNGYKVYWSDGAQLPPQKAEAIAKRRFCQKCCFSCFASLNCVTSSPSTWPTLRNACLIARSFNS